MEGRCDFFDWLDNDDSLHVVVGRLKLKLATSNGIIKRLRRLNTGLFFCNAMMFAFAGVVVYLCVKGCNK